jgi:hypothetical protein
MSESQNATIAPSLNGRAASIEQICEAGDEAFVRYLAELRDGTKFRNTEYFRIEGSKIKEIAVYFGASVSEVG